MAPWTSSQNIDSKPKYGPSEFIEVAERFNDAWSHSLDELPMEDFLSLYSPNVEWLDHAFLIHRIGHVGIEMLRTRWLTSNQPLKSVIKAVHPTSTGVVAELTCTGVFAKDLYHIKATGKPFTYNACFVLGISAETGLIEKVDEYYTRLWYESIDVAEYRVDKTKEGAIGLPSS